VGHLLRRLSEHEAARRVGTIEAAARQIVQQRLVIELRIVAAQRELEPVLALGGSMTRAGVQPTLFRIGATSRRYVTLGASAADATPAMTNTPQKLPLIWRSIRGTSAHIEWNGARHNRFAPSSVPNRR